MYTVIITGTRNDLTIMMKDRVNYCLSMLAYRVCPQGGLLKHGGASGVDSYGRDTWVLMGPEYETEEFPYMTELGRAGGPARNQKMVNSGADLCLAFPVQGSIGTYDCAKKATAAGIDTFILDGMSTIQRFQRYALEHKRTVW